MSLVKIILHGALKEACSREIVVEAKTARLALSALRLQPELNPANNPKLYNCKVRGVEHVLDLDAPLETNELHVICDAVIDRSAYRGAGNNPYVRIIIGVVLIVVGVTMMGMGGETVGNLGLAMAASGFGMVLGGIMQLFTKDPKAEEQERNKSLTGYENTVKSGTPIPFILGEHLHGGHIFSLNTETRQGKDLDLKAFKDTYAITGSKSWFLLHDGSGGVSTNGPSPGGRPGGPGRGGEGEYWP